MALRSFIALTALFKRISIKPLERIGHKDRRPNSREKVRGYALRDKTVVTFRIFPVIRKCFSCFFYSRNYASVGNRVGRPFNRLFSEIHQMACASATPAHKAGNTSYRTINQHTFNIKVIESFVFLYLSHSVLRHRCGSISKRHSYSANAGSSKRTCCGAGKHGSAKAISKAFIFRIIGYHFNYTIYDCSNCSSRNNMPEAPSRICTRNRRVVTIGI